MSDTKRLRHEKLELYNDWADHLEEKDGQPKYEDKGGWPDLIDGGCSESIKIGSRNKKTEYK